MSVDVAGRVSTTYFLTPDQKEEMIFRVEATRPSLRWRATWGSRRCASGAATTCRLLLWLTVAFALAGGESAVVALLRESPPPAAPTTKGYRVLPYATAAWMWSSLLSVLTLLLFGHQTIFVMFHFVRLFTQLLHLLHVAVIWHWHTSAVIVLVIACFSLMATLERTCEMASGFLTAEAILDTLCWSVCFFVPAAQPRAFAALRHALLWQLIGVGVQVLAVNATQASEPVAWFRTFSLAASCVAIYWASVALDEVVFGPTDVAQSCSRRMIYRMFGSMLQLRCEPATREETARVSDLADEPKAGWTVPADVRACARVLQPVHERCLRGRARRRAPTRERADGLLGRRGPRLPAAGPRLPRDAREPAARPARGVGAAHRLARAMYYAGVQWLLALAFGMTLGLGGVRSSRRRGRPSSGSARGHRPEFARAACARAAEDVQQRVEAQHADRVEEPVPLERSGRILGARGDADGAERRATTSSRDEALQGPHISRTQVRRAGARARVPASLRGREHAREQRRARRLPRGEVLQRQQPLGRATHGGTASLGTALSCVARHLGLRAARVARQRSAAATAHARDRGGQPGKTRPRRPHRASDGS